MACPLGVVVLYIDTQSRCGIPGWPAGGGCLAVTWRGADAMTESVVASVPHALESAVGQTGMGLRLLGSAAAKRVGL